jgi:Asp/Glu/hydantoin racemase
MKLKGGRTHYGEAIGILTLDTKFPRIPGDIGNATSYNFPVRFKTVKGATIDKIVKEGDPAQLVPFIEAAKELEREGVRGITTSCGFLAMFQERLAEELEIPVFTSSLMMVPLVHRMLGKNNRVGILTADSSSLKQKHFEGAGMSDIPVEIAGMQVMEEFSKPMLKDELTYDPKKIEQEMVQVAKKMVDENPDIGAIVLECANMPPYKEAVQRALGIPVFDINDFVNFVYNATVPRDRFSKGYL